MISAVADIFPSCDKGADLRYEVTLRPPNTPCDPLPVIITNQRRGGRQMEQIYFDQHNTKEERWHCTGSDVPVATEIDTGLNVIGSSSRLVSEKSFHFLTKVLEFNLKVISLHIWIYHYSSFLDLETYIYNLLFNITNSLKKRFGWI